jgi:hypothetical protein
VHPAERRARRRRLCEPLDHEDAMIVTTILRCLADPAAEAELPLPAD